MRNLNVIITSVSLFIASLSLTSCEDEGYSLGDFGVAIATVNPLVGNSYSLTMDDGTTLWPAAQSIFYKPKTNQRAFINYTPLADNIEGYDLAVKINDIIDILTKNPTVLNTETRDSLGNDPIRLNNYWIGDGYLNIYFSFIYTPGANKHFINLAKNELNGKENYYNFTHNAYGDLQGYRSNGYVAFNLDDLKEEGKTSTEFTLAVNTGNEIKEYTINYDWADNSKPSAKIDFSQKSAIEIF